MALAELVAHDNRALSCLSLAPLQVGMVERRSLKVVNSGVESAILEDLLELLTGLGAPHDDHIGVHVTVVLMKALFQEVLDSLVLTISKQQDVLGVFVRFHVTDPAVL